MVPNTAVTNTIFFKGNKHLVFHLPGSFASFSTWQFWLFSHSDSLSFLLIILFAAAIAEVKHDLTFLCLSCMLQKMLIFTDLRVFLYHFTLGFLFQFTRGVAVRWCICIMFGMLYFIHESYSSLHFSSKFTSIIKYTYNFYHIKLRGLLGCS